MANRNPFQNAAGPIQDTDQFIIQQDTGTNGTTAADIKAYASVQYVLPAATQTVNGGVKKTSFNVFDFGVVGDGNTDDTAAFQSAITAAIAGNSKLIIPSPSEFYKITSTLNVHPSSGSECYLDLECQGIPRSQIVYSGATNTTCFSIIGLRFSTWTGLKILLGANSGLIGFDIDTSSSAGSTSFDTFINCQVALGSGTSQIGWRIGQVSGGGADISDLLWQTSSVYGGSTTPITGQEAWAVKGSNTLNNSLLNCFGAYLDTFYSNKSGGNGSIYFYGTGTSHNNLEFDIANNQTYLISGGRFEVGKRILTLETGSVAPAITFQNTEFDGYTPTDGILFYMDMPGCLKLDNVNIQAPTGQPYTSSMIKGFGGGSSLNGSLIVSGGSIEAADPFYLVNQNGTLWSVDINSVGQLSSGSRVAMMANRSHRTLITAPNGGTVISDIDYLTTDASQGWFFVPYDTDSHIGDVVSIIGKGSGGWRLWNKEAGGVIHFGANSTTAGTAGYIASNLISDVITVKKTGALEWTTISAIGTPTTH